MSGKSKSLKTPTSSKVANHYSNGGLKKKIKKGLNKAGLDSKSLTLEDIASVDEFHLRGREATEELVNKLDLGQEDKVLDVGCGIGGTARYIAEKSGSTVTGLDITPEFIGISKWLNDQVDLENPPKFIQGDATDMPFDEGAFDVVITEHVNMNIKDKEKFLTEMYRVVKKGGRVCFYEILAGPSQPVKFPVPWSETSSTSFLASEKEIKRLFEKTGFSILSWEDTTPKAKAWYEKLVERNKKEGPSPLGIHLILGKKAPDMFQNLGKNFQEGRIKVVQVILQK